VLLRKRLSALSALLLRHGGDLGAGWFFGPIERGIRAGTNLYLWVVRGLMRVRWAMAVVFLGLLGLTYYVYNQVPRAFVPEEDAGYFISIIQAPPGASLEYTGKVAAEAEKILLAVPEVESVFSVLGFSFAGSASNVRTPVMSSFQPGKYSKIGLAWWKSLCDIGISSCRMPSTSYATHTGMRSQPVNTSSLVRTKSVTPLTRAA
jgi:multidrug efflux pump subunit AcrB